MPSVCRLTAPLPSAIATLLLTGDGVHELLVASGLVKQSTLLIGKIYFCKWPLQLSGTTVHEHVVVCRTAHDRIEVSCHGGSAICNAIIDSLVQASFQVTEANNLQSSLACQLSREAEADLIKAQTDLVAAILLDQANGCLSEEIAAIQRILQNLLLEQKNADRDLTTEAEKTLANEIQARVRGLLDWAPLGVHLTDPWKVVLAGPPNVGKSSLLNSICGQQKAIVHQEAGTTRDWISDQVVIQGWPLIVTDTAGIRESSDSIETQGVIRAEQQVQEADLLVLVVDSTEGWTQTHQEISMKPGAKLVAWNKSDLESKNLDPNRCPSDLSVVHCSAIGSPGIEELLQRMIRMLVPSEPEPEQPVPFRDAQVKVLTLVYETLGAGEYESALGYLNGLRQPDSVNS